MPYATTPDNVKLYYEEVGQGTPILFVHEFAGDHRSWERQLREFGKRYRCIAYNARGYRPSDVPVDSKAYSYMHVMRDAVAMLDHLKIDKAHLIGLSMGGYTALQVALNYPLSVARVLAGARGCGIGQRALVHRGLPQTLARSRRAVRAPRLCGSGADVWPRPEPPSIGDQGSARLCRIFEAAFRARPARISAHVSRVPGRAPFAL